MINRHAFTCAALATSLLLGNTPVNADPHAPPRETTSTAMSTGFATSLRAESRYRLGEPVTLDFELRNTSAQDYAVLVWDTPLEGKTLHYLTVRRGDREVPYDGPVFKRGMPTAASYRTVPAGRTARGTVELTKAFAITEPGTYTVTLDARLRDAVPAAEVAPGRTATGFAEHRLDRVTVTFEVLPGGAPRLTNAEATRRSSPLAQVAPAADPNVEGGTTAQKETIVKAHHTGYDMARKAVRNLPQPPPAQALRRYVEWFGAYDKTRYDIVRDSYRKIDRYLANGVMTYYPTGPECNDDDFAYVIKGIPRKTWLCPAFWRAGSTGFDSQPGTVVHETSHLAVDTGDHAYRPDGARRLARQNPGKAITNADNYEYFAETAS